MILQDSYAYCRANIQQNEPTAGLAQIKLTAEQTYSRQTSNSTAPQPNELTASRA